MSNDSPSNIIGRLCTKQIMGGGNTNQPWSGLGIKQTTVAIATATLDH